MFKLTTDIPPGRGKISIETPVQLQAPSETVRELWKEEDFPRVRSTGTGKNIFTLWPLMGWCVH